MAHVLEKECLSASNFTRSHYRETADFSPQLLSSADYQGQDGLYPESPDYYQDEGYFSDAGFSSPPNPGIDMIRMASTPSSVVHGRRTAAGILSMCRTMLTTLELTRMRKTRMGIQYWTAFWRRIYKPPLSDTICLCILEMSPQMDKIFKMAAEHIINTIAITDERIASARSEDEIGCLLRQMELQINRCVELRQIKAQIIFEATRVNLEKIPVDVGDAMFDDLKRGIFALDSVGNYHPGDPAAEEKDKHVGRPIAGENYIFQQPDLLFRPGFTGEFQDALEDAANTADEGYESVDPEDVMEVEDTSDESETMEDFIMT